MTDEDRPEETGPEAGPGTPPGARIFEEDTGGPRPLDGPAETADLVLDLDGYEGPLDVLLSLARDQKVDLTQISILQLAEQYIAFIERARQLRLEIAAEYLVMAAWLAYLKSRLLLPREEEETEEPTGPELAAALAFQLRRFEAMQEAGEKLLARPQLGRDVFTRGAPDGIRVRHNVVYEVSLFDLLKTYGDQRRKIETSSFTIEAPDLFTMDDAIQRLNSLLGTSFEWRALETFLPDGLRDPLVRRSAVAATFAAGLEMARQGRVQIRQSSAFGPIFYRTPAGNP
ncbi:MAG: ScpA family protein [Alphaproteobacteria bacterium]